MFKQSVSALLLIFSYCCSASAATDKELILQIQKLEKRIEQLEKEIELVAEMAMQNTEIAKSNNKLSKTSWRLIEVFHQEDLKEARASKKR